MRQIGRDRPTGETMQGRSKQRSVTRNSATGPGSASFKYDVLTALLAKAVCSDGLEARLALRLSLLITARFNWRLGTFSVGLREMARMWGVTERTAKREVAAMRGLVWLTVSVPPARGRVATYRIEFETVLRSTMAHWDAVGPDFAARMVGAPDPVDDTKVIPLHTHAALPAPDDIGWHLAAALLQSQDPAVYNAWLATLTVGSAEAGLLTLKAPSAFAADYVRTHYKARLLAAVITVNGGIRDIDVVVG